VEGIVQSIVLVVGPFSLEIVPYYPFYYSSLTSVKRDHFVQKIEQFGFAAKFGFQATTAVAIN
jgi:hypothetical protein